MRYEDLDDIWKNIFELEWESLINKSKAIAALITDENGNIISTGRNKVGEHTILNPRVCHAETEAVRNLDVGIYPNVKIIHIICRLRAMSDVPRNDSNGWNKKDSDRRSR